MEARQESQSSAAHDPIELWEVRVFGNSTPSSEETTALAALLTSDNQGTASVLQVTTTLAVACATYLVATTGVLLSDFVETPVLLLLLPAPILLIQCMQSFLAASAVQRSISAEVHERRLKRIAGHSASQINALGSCLTTDITDPTFITGDSARTRRVFAQLPYVGLYALGLLYTIVVVFRAGQLADGVLPWLAVVSCGILYFVGWAGLTRSAQVNFTKLNAP